MEENFLFTLYISASAVFLFYKEILTQWKEIQFKKNPPQSTVKVLW